MTDSIPVLWYGPEVEGRLSGIKTLFVGDLAAPSQVLDAAKDYSHIYVNPGYIKSHGYNEVLELARSRYVTIGLYPDMLEQLDDAVLEVCHVMLILLCPSARLLKLTDTVRLDLDVKGYNCYSFSVQSAIKTNPDHYRDDVVIAWSE